MLDFRTETFIAVCRHMNFTKAAKELNITQPAVSQQIHYLEEYFGTPLFFCEKRKLRLTGAGEEVLSVCLSFKNDREKLMRRLKERDKARHIIIGATLTIGEYVLPPYLSRLMKENKKYRITVLIEDTKTLLEALDRGEAEAAFVEGYFPKERYEYKSWRSERLLPVCSADFELSGEPDGSPEKKYSVKELLKYPLILREKGSGTRDTLEHFLSCENISINDFAAVTEVGGIEAVKTLVRLGSGISFLYESAVKKEIEEGSLRMLSLSEEFKNEFTYIRRKGSVYEQEYREFFRELFVQEGEEIL